MASGKVKIERYFYVKYTLFTNTREVYVKLYQCVMKSVNRKQTLMRGRRNEFR